MTVPVEQTNGIKAGKDRFFAFAFCLFHLFFPVSYLPPPCFWSVDQYLVKGIGCKSLLRGERAKKVLNYFFKRFQLDPKTKVVIRDPTNNCHVPFKNYKTVKFPKRKPLFQRLTEIPIGKKFIPNKKTYLQEVSIIEIVAKQIFLFNFFCFRNYL